MNKKKTVNTGEAALIIKRFIDDNDNPENQKALVTLAGELLHVVIELFYQSGYIDEQQMADMMQAVTDIIKGTQ